MKWLLGAGIGMLWAAGHVEPLSLPLGITAQSIQGARFVAAARQDAPGARLAESLNVSRHDLLGWPKKDLADSRPGSLPIIVFTQMPLLTAYQNQRWGTNDAAQALSDLQGATQSPG